MLNLQVKEKVMMGSIILNYKTMAVYNKLLLDFKSLYWEYVPLSIIFQSCIGSMAAMMILAAKGPFYIVQLGICILLSMLYNAAILAQLKSKLVFDILLISLGINILLLILNIWKVV